jgi:DNA-binding CsgD family transcriptional regulator
MESVVVLALGDAGRMADADQRAAVAFAEAVDRSDRIGQAWLAGAWSHVDLLRGRPLDALRRARESALVFGETSHPAARWGLAMMVMAASHVRDLDTVTATTEDLDVELPSELAVLDVEVNRGRVWGLTLLGRISTARTALLEIAGRARGMGQLSLEYAVLHDIARLGDAAAVLDRVEELSAEMEGPLMVVRRDHVRGLASSDGEVLDACAEQFAELGCGLFAAEAATAAAAAHRRSGATRAAGASEFVARRHAASCQGAETPALRLAPAAEELTSRELEVASLAAIGRTNRQIADELVVSIRTVENHLQRVYAKVGVSSRDELAGLLGRTAPGTEPA